MTEVKSFSQCTDKEWFHRVFAELPERVRKGKNRIGLVPAEVGRRFLDLVPQRASEFWVMTLGGEVVARIGANLMPSYPEKGAVGFFEVDLVCEDYFSLSQQLIEVAENWLRSKGVTTAVGPMNFNTWFSYRFRVDDHEETLVWEPNNPPEYPHLFQELKYQTSEDYNSTATSGLDLFVEKTEKNIKCMKENGLSYRVFDGKNLLTQEVPILYELSMKGFNENTLFEPIPFQLFSELYVPIANKMDFSHCFFAVNSEGKEVGFFFCFVENGYLILKSTTILPDYRGLGLSNALAHLAGKVALEKGVTKYIPALVECGNRSESYAKKGGTLWTHHYVLFEKKL